MKVFHAKVYQRGGSQTVCLPKDCRFRGNQHEILIRREGSRVILEPTDDWPDTFRACLGAWRDDIPRPKQKTLSALKTENWV